MSAVMPLFLLGLLVLYVLGWLRGYIRPVVLLFSLGVAFFALTLFLVLTFVVPSWQLQSNPLAVWAPALVSLLALVSGVVSLFVGRGARPPAAGRGGAGRWVALAAGLAVLLGGWILSLMAIYVEPVLRAVGSPAGFAVACTVLAWLAGCLLLYLASRPNTDQRPNLMRWLVLGLAFFFTAHLPLVLSLILIYAPGEFLAPAPVSAAWASLAYLPLAALFLLIARDFRPAPARRAAPPPPREEQAPAAATDQA
jgi:hypothetical protein